MPNAQHRDVGFGAGAEMTELGVLDDLGGACGVGLDDVRERHAHVQELRHRVQDVLHAAVLTADVQVGADHVGMESLLHRGDGLPE